MRSGLTLPSSHFVIPPPPCWVPLGLLPSFSCLRSRGPAPGSLHWQRLEPGGGSTQTLPGEGVRGPAGPPESVPVALGPSHPVGCSQRYRRVSWLFKRAGLLKHQPLGKLTTGKQSKVVFLSPRSLPPFPRGSAYICAHDRSQSAYTQPGSLPSLNTTPYASPRVLQKGRVIFLGVD